MSVPQLPKPNLEPPTEMVCFKNMTQLASLSKSFRRVFYTSKNAQVVIMTIQIGSDIPKETHEVDQVLNFHSGTAKCVVNGKTEVLSAGDVLIVPAGAEHQIFNAGPTELIISTIYAGGPDHKPDTVHETRDEAEELEESGKDEPPKW